jgi:hypothetical protein
LGKPHLKELYNRYYPKGLEIIGIAREFYQDERGQVSWKRAVEQDSLPWPQLLNSNMPQDVVKIYDVKTFPTKILVAPDGTILWRGGSKDITDLDNILQNIFDKHSQ